MPGLPSAGPEGRPAGAAAGRAKLRISDQADDQLRQWRAHQQYGHGEGHAGAQAGSARGHGALHRRPLTGARCLFGCAARPKGRAVFRCGHAHRDLRTGPKHAVSRQRQRPPAAARAPCLFGRLAARKVAPAGEGAARQFSEFGFSEFDHDRLCGRAPNNGRQPGSHQRRHRLAHHRRHAGAAARAFPAARAGRFGVSRFRCSGGRRPGRGDGTAPAQAHGARQVAAGRRDRGPAIMCSMSAAPPAIPRLCWRSWPARWWGSRRTPGWQSRHATTCARSVSPRSRWCADRSPTAGAPKPRMTSSCSRGRPRSPPRRCCGSSSRAAGWSACWAAGRRPRPCCIARSAEKAAAGRFSMRHAPLLPGFAAPAAFVF